MDTCLTALIQGVSRSDRVYVFETEAPGSMIWDPNTTCIETGGAGLVHLNNFDHHDSSAHLPPACIQALERRGVKDSDLICLARYVADVDLGRALPEKIEYPSLSNLFSGMRLTEKNFLEQFFKGIEILKTVLEKSIDPFSPMPRLDQWVPYIAAKTQNWNKAVQCMAKNSRYFTTLKGTQVGYCRQPYIGGFGHLFQSRCTVGILFHSNFGPNGIPKVTIAARDKNLTAFASVLNRTDPGWGGHERIIGSPRKCGTRLSETQLLDIVWIHL